ncbi:hypothetical protein [Streptomyces pinistramenti]|uniref:hypothetical protein n=1 Tax=Streptomyces pinistramenti TaxID=2884812 RepID=UPI001D074472|nr:hypothetical protein [Streptomyces pinistramenti]MCB5907646.1 hypothetical protein [Streptomyces pinistramenti]
MYRSTARRAGRLATASLLAVAAVGLTAAVSNAATAPATPAAHTSAVAHGVSGTWHGTLKYLAPGKMTVAPKSGAEQGFYVGPHTKVLGAAAICSSDGSVTIDKQGYGTSKCTEAQLTKAAKTNSVRIRVTVKNGVATTVAEHYHP